MNARAAQHDARNAWRAWAAVLIATLALLALVRLLLGVASLPVTWDEKYIQPVLDVIFNTRWSLHSLIDYDDTKGPIFFWLYAAFGELFGRDLATLRWCSIVCSALWVALLVWLIPLANRRPGRITCVALLAITLPYSLVMSQLVMSEPSFLLGCAAMAVVAVRSLTDERERVRRVLGPLLFGVLYALLLHHRIHAIALAGGVVILAAVRDRWRSWPWWLAGLLAGLSRIPLWLRWGGLVGESFQHRYNLGIRLDSLGYLSAALLPTIGLILVAAFLRRRELSPKALGLMLMVGGLGAGLMAVAPPAISSDREVLNFAGPIASLLRPIADSPLMLSGALAVLSALGMMAMTALGLLTWRHSLEAAPLARCGSQLACLTIIFGWLLSALAGGDVYDRYLLAFTFLWPLLCVRLMPRPLVLAQIAWQVALTAGQAWVYLR